MLPGVLTDTYKRYKEDTVTFTTWLAQVSQSCGWKPAAAPQTSTTRSLLYIATNLAKGPRLKGKDRKLAKEAAKSAPTKQEPTQAGPIVKYSVTTKELLEQAELVTKVRKGKNKLPENVKRTLERAIEARKRCAAWYQTTDIHNEFSASNEKHKHFINVLEKAAILLGGTHKQGKGQSQIPASKEADVMSNYFASLEVENLSSEDDDILTPADLSASIPSTKKQNATAIYELDADPQMELSFQIFCFFEDTHLLQGEVRKAWHMFQSGKLTLVAATVVATVAIELVSRAEKELIAANPGIINPSQSYQDMALMIMSSESLRQGIDLDEYLRSVEDLEITPFKEFMFLPVGRTLMRLAQQQILFEKSGFPVPLQSMKHNYIAWPELLDSPHMQKIQAEDQLICQLFQDYQLMDDFKEAEAGLRARDKSSELRIGFLPRFDDVFADAVNRVRTAGEVQMRSVFATRALLDILDICPDFDGVQLLHEEGHRQYELFEFYIDDDGALDNRSGFRWLTKDWYLVKEIYDRVTSQMLDPGFVKFKELMLGKHEREPKLPNPTLEDAENAPPGARIDLVLSASLKPRVLDDLPEWDDETKKRFEENAKKLNLKSVPPHPNAALFIDKNPLFCGTLLLSQLVSVEAAGIALANHHLSLFAMAHLYNALKQMALTNIVWPDMERVMQLHSGPLFADDIPSNPEEIRARLFFRLGIDRFMRLNPDRKNNAKKYMEISSASHLLLQFFNNTQPLERTVYQLQEDLFKREAKDSQPESVTSRNHKAESLTFLSQHKFIDRLERFATAALSETQIPYLGLTKLCIHFLQSVREALEAKMYPVIARPDTGDSNDMSLILMVADILHENSITWEKSGAKNEPGRKLRLVANNFEHMWTYMQSDLFKEIRPRYFSDGKAEARLDAQFKEQLSEWIQRRT